MLKDKISQETFFRYLKLLKETSEYINGVYEATRKSLDIINLVDDVTRPYYIIEKLFFTPIELEIIQWFLYEYEDGRMQIYDSENKMVIADIVNEEALWDYLNREDFDAGKPLTHIPEYGAKTQEEIEAMLSGFLS